MWRGWYGNSAKALLIVVGALNWCFGQSYFNTVRLEGNNNISVVPVDTGYIVLQQGFFPTGINNLEIDFFDNNGIFQNQDSIMLGAFFEDCPNCLISHDKGYIKAGIFAYAQDSFEVALVQLDKNFDSTGFVSFSYKDEITTYPYGIEMFGPNEIMVTGLRYIKSGPIYQLYAARLDSNLNVLWDSVYSRYPAARPEGYLGYDIAKAGDGGYLFSGLETYAIGGKPKGFILKTDSLGGEEWRKELTGPEGNNEVLLHPINDSVFSFITTQRISEPFPDQYWTRFRKGKIDMYGNILQDTLIGPQTAQMSTAFFEPTKDGYYVTAGYAQNLNWGSYAMKFSEEGDSIWFRQYFHGSEHFVDKAYIESMAHTPDSGFIFCGYFMDLGPGGRGAHTWLVKTDKYGCDTAGCHTVSTREYSVPAVEVLVYPNPFEDELVIKWEGEDLHHPLNLRLTNSQGKLLIDQRIEDYQKNTCLLPVKNLKPGVYILEIQHEEQRIHVERLVRK